MNLSAFMNKNKLVLKNLIKDLNSICTSYKPLLETIGIIVGLYLIYLTYVSVEISNEQLKITQKQEYQKQLPIWQFEIDDSLSIAKLKPFSQDVKLEQATGYFPKNLFFKNSNKWEIDQPNFELHLTMFKAYAEQLIERNMVFKDSTVSVAMRNNFPIGIDLNYVQFGELKETQAIFAIQYSWVASSKYDIKIHLDGIKFTKYIYNNENLMDELEKISKDVYPNVKLPE
ncbi:hypothetical protein AAEO57_08365 [Flavobacterium sp. DGU38]|uniref:Uncharacterized protein n=1 Tax=Flavobacterium calami TaxID=3139144 RepID=A0ABU9IMW7_9FLAO